MYGEYHEVPYKSNVQETIIGPFSWSQLGWLTPGLILSFKLAQTIPQLPIDSLVFSRVHWFIPLVFSVIAAYFKDSKTNLTITQLVITQFKIRRRQRAFYYRRLNMPSWEEVEER